MSPKKTGKAKKLNFANETIWTSDNLPVLRGMNSNSVDLIYLDPPFNSNRRFEAPIGSKAAKAAFKDIWTLDDVDLCEHGELAEYNPAAYSVIQAARDAHGKSMQAYLIFMAVRLMEMQRVMKPTGSIYLHCDTTANHYLKLLMDSIFGRDNFRNEIVWARSNSGKTTGKKYASDTDHLLFYAGPDQSKINPVYKPLSEKTVQAYNKDDGDGRGAYRLFPMNKTGGPGPLTTYDYISNDGRTWPCPAKGWRMRQEKMRKLENDNRLVFSGKVYEKAYWNERADTGKAANNLWDDIPNLQGNKKEKTGFPTQKPLALLERIIKASSNPDDFVLDPFCGCATTLVAADRLSRQWAGIDISHTAIRLVNDRIKEDRGMFGGATALDEPPRRTDLGKLPHYRTHKQELFGKQQGKCAGCEQDYPFQIFEVDHVLPTSKGGTDHIENLQLLCSYCNRSKGSKTMAEWKAGER